MSDVLVVGGGIVGLLSALELTQRERTVTIIDAPASCPPASWAGGGILTPLYAWRYDDPMTQLCTDAVARFEGLLNRLDTTGRADKALLNRGGVWVAVDENERGHAQDWARRWGVTTEACGAAALMPASTLGNGLFFPQQGNIRNSGFLKVLRQHLRSLGVVFETAQIESVESGRHSVSVLSSDKRVWQGGQLLLSAGRGAQPLLSGLGVELPLFAAKGEMLLYQMQPGAVPAVMLTEQGYLIPRNDGAVLVGSTLRKGDATHYPTVSGRYQLEALAQRLWPALGKVAPSFHWAGVRPGCERDYPYLGPVPGHDRVFAAAGHYRNGLVSSPASAELLVQMMCEETPFIDPAPYSLSSSSSRSSSSFLSR